MPLAKSSLNPVCSELMLKFSKGEFLMKSVTDPPFYTSGRSRESIGQSRGGATPLPRDRDQRKGEHMLRLDEFQMPPDRSDVSHKQANCVRLQRQPVLCCCVFDGLTAS